MIKGNENAILQSKTIDFLRFYLIIWIVFIHIGIRVQDYGVGVKVVYDLFSQILSRVAVPLFFIISGYLFFLNKDEKETFSKKTYTRKMKSRVKTLLVPYLIWNFMAIVYLLVLQSMNVDSSYFVYSKDVTTYTIKDFLLCFSYRAGDEPVLFQFWFLRDLILICILSPIVYLLTKYLKFIPLLCLFLFWLIGNHTSKIVDLEGQTLCFFFLGAYLSINKKNMVDICRKFSFYSLILYLLLIVLSLSISSPFMNYVRRINIIIGVVATIYLISTIIERKNLIIDKSFAQIAFFIFGFHTFIIKYVQLFFSNLLPNNDLFCVLIYFLSITLTVICCILLYKVLNKVCPWFVSLLVGGR
jgi:peptidoglycan/LPS O-acetylase OafA/YrhL